MAGFPAFLIETFRRYIPRLETYTDLEITHRHLYVQALAELQAVDESDELSYFQIMGAESTWQFVCFELNIDPRYRYTWSPIPRMERGWSGLWWC